MRLSPFERAQLPVLTQQVEVINQAFGAPVVVMDPFAMPVVAAQDLRDLGERKRGWYFTEAVYEAIHGETIPSRAHAVRLGHQLKAHCAHTKKRGAKRMYWLAPEGVPPPERVGVV